MSVSARAVRILFALAVTVLVAAPLGLVWAGHAIFRGGAVGGISIDPAGVVREPNIEHLKMLLNDLRKNVKAAEGDLNAPVEMRKVSLRRLEEAIQDAITNNFGQLPEDVQFLAGLQRIQYILVYPDQNDIVLAGPGEGWRIDDQANVVGVTTGRPVLRLDDLVVALRTIREARENPVTCSIDPTPEGVRQAQELLDRQKRTRTPVVPARLGPELKKAMGPQLVTLEGIAPTTHFARVMVSADYHMKRLAMDIDPAPVPNFDSYIKLLANSTESMPRPRWWLACNYDQIARSEDGLVWELRGAGVQALTEENVIGEDGTITPKAGKTSKLAQKWADMMTEKYDELSGKLPIFAEMRNLMDLAVVAAILETHDLCSQASCELPLLYGTQSALAAETWNAPKTVDTACSFAPTRGGWLVATAGGVKIDAWTVANQTADDAELGPLHATASRSEDAKWWWN